MFDALPDIPRLYTALAEWAAVLVYVACVVRTQHEGTPSRSAAVRFAATLGAGLVALIGVQVAAGRAPLSLWVPGMLVAFIAMWVGIRFTTGMDWRWSTHLGVRAFVVAELSASLAWQVVVFFFPDTPYWDMRIIAGYTLMLVACLGVVYLYESRVLRRGQLPELEVGDVLTALAIGVATFALSNLSFISVSTPFSGRSGLEVFYIRTLVDVAGYAVLYAQFERIQQTSTQRELASIQASLDAQHRQYLSAKVDMEQVARAHHDLKHQVEAIRMELDPHRRSAHFEELESSLSQIGQQYHTGNAVLDVVLTSKGHTCASEKINFTAVADGALLGEMSSMDISTLFGNALDNAIEASRRIADPSKRLIKLALFRQGQMVVIRISNWFDGHLNTDAGGRLTTIKNDSVHHGWGVKSIQWTAHKYGGQAVTHARDHWFTLTVLLPSTTPTEED